MSGGIELPERREVVLSLLRREEPATVLARRSGISENTLYRWRDEFMTAGEAALANGKGKADPRDRLIAALTVRVSWPSGSISTSRICTAMLVFGIARLRNLVCWSGFIRR